MAHDLVRWHNAPPPPAPPDTIDEGETWNLPPEADLSDGGGTRPQASNTGTARRTARPSSAATADRDAAHARQRGDDTFASLRATDAAEQRQSNWDWGDAKTWLWIAAMFFGFLLLVACVYYLPYGRHNQADGGNTSGAPTPTIRVY